MGLDTVAVILIPSYLAYRQWIPTAVIARIKQAFDTTDALGIFICIVIVGSILGIDRRALFSGASRILLPLTAATLISGLVGTGVGAALGMAPTDVLLRVVVPIMSGGLTAGALPLSVGYAQTLGGSQGEILAQMLPAVILGNLCAIVGAGLLDSWAGTTVARAENSNVRRLLADAPPATDGDSKGRTARAIAGGAVIAAFYLAGLLASRRLSLPAPLVVLVLTLLLRLGNLPGARLQQGVDLVYRVSVKIFIYPLLFFVGLVLTPWQTLIAGLGWTSILTIAATVATLAMSGIVLSRWAGIQAVDGAVVTITRAAMGGSGDIAVLSAARRLGLMPFAQVSTRLGGAVTVAATLLSIRM
jgi:Na+/citrate or Na+/malate symporter